MGLLPQTHTAKEAQAMANTRSVFSQLLQHIPRFEFQRIIDRYDGDKGVRTLATWSQFVALLFGQLTGHNSLRAICAGLKSARKKLYHLGISFEIYRSTLADANDKRNPKMFEEIFFRLLPKVQALAPRHKISIKNKVLALDSTTIELCLSLSPWAQFHHDKGAFKLHVAIDIAGDLPTIMVLTDGRKSDIRIAKTLSFSPGTFLLIDRGYVDTDWLWKLNRQGIFFVTRLKEGMKFKVRECRKTNRTQGIMADQEIKLNGPKGKQYEGKIRRISYRDPQTGHRYVFLTNRFDLSAKTICDLYKARWRVELFFKTLKQQLQVRRFVGTSVNAVLAQVWVAFIAYLLLMLVKYQARLGWTLPAIMAGLTVVLFANSDLKNIWEDVPKERCVNKAFQQLALPLF